MSKFYLLRRQDYLTQITWEKRLHGICEELEIQYSRINTLAYDYRVALTVTEFLGIKTIVTVGWDSVLEHGSNNESSHRRPDDHGTFNFFFETPSAFYAGQGVTAEQFSPDREKFDQDYFLELTRRLAEDPEHRNLILSTFQRLRQEWLFSEMEKWFNSKVTLIQQLRSVVLHDLG